MDELQGQDIPTIILLGTFGILLLVGCIGVFVLLYQKRMLEEKQKRTTQELEYQNLMIKLQLESQEQERKRIGADLHDSLGSLLWGAKVNASFIQRSMDIKDHVLTSFNELNQILEESIGVIRRISWELTPEAFHYSGLSESVKKLCGRLDGKGQSIVFLEEGTRHWNDERALQAFRITQELLNNALKHSGASTIKVSIAWGEEDLDLNVEDNGSGIVLDQGKKGVGLWNINQRVNQLKGKIDIGNPPIEKGTQIHIKIPLINDDKNQTT